MSRERYNLRKSPDLFFVDDRGNIAVCIDTLRIYSQITKPDCTRIYFTDPTFTDEKFQLIEEELSNYTLYTRANKVVGNSTNNSYFCQKFSGLRLGEASFNLPSDGTIDSLYLCEIFAAKKEIINPLDCPIKTGTDEFGNPTYFFQRDLERLGIESKELKI